MRYLAPSWVFTAEALDAARDPTIARGVHVHVQPSWELGLPARPFKVARVRLTPEELAARARTEVRWRDVDGNELVTPFEVTPDRPVTGYLPIHARGRCVWFELVTVPPEEPVVITVNPTTGETTTAAPPPPPVAVPISKIPIKVLTPPVRPNLGPLAGKLGQVNVPRIPIDVRPRIPEHVIDKLLPPLALEAHTTSPRGDVIVAIDSKRPHQVAAPRIERVVVRGTGMVYGARWIDAASVVDGKNLLTWRELDLPVAEATWYDGFDDAEARAKGRVHGGAPQRRGLHEDPARGGAAATATVRAEDEWARIEELRPDVDRWLAMLLGSSRPHDVVDERPVNVARGSGTARVGALGALLQSALDPGMARYLGLADVDHDAHAAGDVIVYVVDGEWIVSSPERIGVLGMLTIPPESLEQIDPAELPVDRTRAPATHVVGLEVKPAPVWRLRLSTVACATIGSPSDVPRPLEVREVILGPWLPVPDPVTAPRQVDLRLGAVTPGAGIAFARAAASGLTSLNPRTERGTAIAIRAGVHRDAEGAQETFITDRAAPAPAIDYQLAQCDRFGRWSPWVRAHAAAIARPAPPTPSLQIATAATAATHRDPAAARLQITVPVPPNATLAPGSLRLVRLEVEQQPEIPPAASSTVASAIAGDRLHVEMNGPPLAPATTGRTRLRARWLAEGHSAGAVAGPWCEWHGVDLNDPRPPAPAAIDTSLRYAARPNVLGRSRVELSWPASPDQRSFRVYKTSEAALRHYLHVSAHPGETDPRAAFGVPRERWMPADAALAALAQLGAAANRGERGAIWRRHAGAFGPEVFEHLTPQGIVAVGSVAQFADDVPGSLDELSFYRVVSVSQTGVMGEFTAAPLVPIAVPNGAPPQMPSLRVKLERDAIGPVARITVEVPAGVPATAYRLRRAVNAGRDVLAMPIAHAGAVTAVPDRSTGQAFELVDRGELRDGTPGRERTLREWLRYTWVVEVAGVQERAENEPAARPTAWSPPSAPATGVLIPRDKPAPVAAPVLERTDAATTLEWQHPDPLRAVEPGPYRFEIFRSLADADTKIDVVDPERVRVGDRFRYQVAEPQPGARYRIAIVDPLGRRTVSGLIPPEAARG